MDRRIVRNNVLFRDPVALFSAQSVPRLHNKEQLRYTHVSTCKFALFFSSAAHGMLLIQIICAQNCCILKPVNA
jgi:hypothetical protein